MKFLPGVFVVVLTLGVLDNVECKAHKPADTLFTLCSRKDSKALNECLKKTFTDMRPVLKRGIPSLGITSMDPLHIPKLDVQEGAGNLGLHIIANNFTLKGMNEYLINSIDATMDKKKFNLLVSLRVPNFWITSEYDMSGQILVIPIKGVGTVEFNTTTMDCTVTLKGRVEERAGKEWIEVEDFSFVTKLVGTASMYFANLFNGDKRLGDATNKFLNDNNRDAYAAYHNLPDSALTEVFKDYAIKVFKAYPVKELFLD